VKKVYRDGITENDGQRMGMMLKTLLFQRAFDL